MFRRNEPLFVALLIAFVTPAREMSGQRLTAPPLPSPATAPIVNTSVVPFGPSRLTESPADMRAAAIQRAVSSARLQAPDRQRVWPWFAVGGAVLGGAGVAILAVTQCDAGCQDDGSLSRVPPYVVAGALAGGVVGALVGLIVDSANPGNHTEASHP